MDNIKTITATPISRELAIRVVQNAMPAMLDEICSMAENEKTTLSKVQNCFARHARRIVWGDMFRVDDLSYAAVINGSMEDFRKKINFVNSYLNTMRPENYGQLFIFNSVYKAGYDSVKASGVAESFTKDAAVCFDDPMLKPFFVSGCLNYMRTLIKDHQAGKFEVNTMIRDGKPSTTRLQLEPVSKVMNTQQVPASPCANFRPITSSRPVSCPVQHNTSAISAPAL